MQQPKLLTIREASHWASALLKRDVSESNISYLVQYGKVRKHSLMNILDVLKEIKKIFHSSIAFSLIKNGRMRVN